MVHCCALSMFGHFPSHAADPDPRSEYRSTGASTSTTLLNTGTTDNLLSLVQKRRCSTLVLLLVLIIIIQFHSIIKSCSYAMKAALW
jgi:hypothetical protein